MVPAGGKLKHIPHPATSLPLREKSNDVLPTPGCKANKCRSWSGKDCEIGETINVKSVLFLALGATLAAAGSAVAADHGATASVPVNVLVGGPAHGSAVSLDGARWAGRGPGGRDCECNVPTISVPFYTVRPASPPVRVRAPGMRISSPAIYAPSPSVYIQGPPIYVDAPPVQVAPAQVYVEAPDVHVRPSDVTVAPPEIHFTPASPDHPDEHCCDVAAPPSAPVAAPPPATRYPAPTRAPATDSGYRQEPGERG